MTNPTSRWANRILILSLLGIVYLTLFPFRFTSAPWHRLHAAVFLLGNSHKGYSSALDAFLNILLFVPFGFGLSTRVRKWRDSRWRCVILALAAGVAASYTVELLQLFIPMRDSGWNDVITNSTGSVAGYFLFEFYGGAILQEAQKYEDAVEAWFSPRRGVLLLLVYFGIAFGISILLQRETRLSNWDSQCTLLVGNDASGGNPWRGQVLLLQIWDRALPEKAIRRMVGRKSSADADTGLLGSYDFTGLAPYQDRTKFLPALGWTPHPPVEANARVVRVDAMSWLSTKAPVENLNREIRKSSQFSVHIVCAPAATQNASGRIVSLSQSKENVNFHLRQQGTSLVFYFRNPLSETHSNLAWRVPRAFEAGKVLDIVADYDGSDAFLYLDGKPVPRTYRLNPGASLAHHFTFIRTLDLGGYVRTYETLLFLPAGLLIGILLRKRYSLSLFRRWMLGFGLILPAVLLEILLAMVSGRRIWIGNIVFSLIFGLAGILLVNADRRALNSSRPFPFRDAA